MLRDKKQKKKKICRGFSIPCGLVCVQAILKWLFWKDHIKLLFLKQDYNPACEKANSKQNKISTWVYLLSDDHVHWGAINWKLYYDLINFYFHFIDEKPWNNVLMCLGLFYCPVTSFDMKCDCSIEQILGNNCHQLKWCNTFYSVIR